MPEMTCYACDPPTVIPYAGPAAFTPVWRTHCIRVHPNGTTPPTDRPRHRRARHRPSRPAQGAW